VGVVCGLAWTMAGGDTLKVEATVMPGTGTLELTGSLGDVMKESAEAAFSWVRAHSGELKLEDDFYQKLWNHLALISNYKLDIDYPVEIQHMDKQDIKRERIPYPQKNISRRHYGAIVEQLAHTLCDMPDGDERNELIRLVANQMKRSLANWNSNALDDEKILDDLAEYTNGKISLLPSEVDLISDRDIMAEVQQNILAKKKKKK